MKDACSHLFRPNFTVLVRVDILNGLADWQMTGQDLSLEGSCFRPDGGMGNEGGRRGRGKNGEKKERKEFLDQKIFERFRKLQTS